MYFSLKKKKKSKSNILQSSNKIMWIKNNKNVSLKIHILEKML